MQSRHKMAVWIVFMVVLFFTSMTLSLIERDRAIHLAAFKNGYDEVQREGSQCLEWQKTH